MFSNDSIISDKSEIVSDDTHYNSSNIEQLDGNVSTNSMENEIRSRTFKPNKPDKFKIAHDLPIVASYNLRSLKPKLNSLKNDILERNIQISFLQEIWEQDDDKHFQLEVEKMLEIEGLQYHSAPRPKNSKGKSYGGAAIIVNNRRFSSEKLNI